MSLLDVNNKIIVDDTQMLNDQQLKAFRGSADPKPGILLLSAAPGAGKTEAIVRALAHEIPMNPNMRVVFCTHSNMALKRLVEAAAPKLKKIKQLIVLSSPAKEEYGSYFAPYSRNLLLATVEEILEEFKEKEEREAGEKSDEQRLLKYKQSCEERPRRADERGALKLVLKLRPVLPQVIYATTAMLEDLEMITEQVTHIVMDEAEDFMGSDDPHRDLCYTSGEDSIRGRPTTDIELCGRCSRIC